MKRRIFNVKAVSFLGVVVLKVCIVSLLVASDERPTMETKVYDDIRYALQGTTILPQPRVSRDVSLLAIIPFRWSNHFIPQTIISVLKSHTDLIMGLRKVSAKLQIQPSSIF